MYVRVIMELPRPQVLQRHLQAAKRCNQVYYDSQNNVSLKMNPFRRTVNLIVKGTSTPHHWQNNLMMSVNEIDAHKGFWKYAQECVRDVQELYPDLKEGDVRPGGSIYMAAHSSGCAALTMCLYEVMRNEMLRELTQNWEIELVMFGSPRPEKKKFVEEYNQLLNEANNVNVYRYEVSLDIASSFPPIPGYEHVGGNYVQLNSKILGDPYANHSIHNYIDNIDFVIQNYEVVKHRMANCNEFSL